jgi:hypothetical protein
MLQSFLKFCPIFKSRTHQKQFWMRETAVSESFFPCETIFSGFWARILEKTEKGSAALLSFQE